MTKTINIEDNQYEVIDAKERMTVPDCWVLKNKIGSGHGEAKFYIGNDNAELWNFFDSFSKKCFVLKSDLLHYLDQVKEEYTNPKQPYTNLSTISNDWENYLNEINEFEDEVLYFKIERVDVAPPRVYINAKPRNSEVYKLIRKISLPNITYLSALKLKLDDEEYYYFKLFVDYFDEQFSENIEEEVEIEIEQDESLTEIQKQNINRARKGQGEYRKKLLDECPYCPITMVSDDRLLIASHIKPWAHSEKNEKTDPKNGFMFTPTYDFLFDRGFITFTDDQKMIVSPWLSKMTCGKLNLVEGKKYPLLITEGKEIYLEYHRTKIFKL